MVTTIKKIAEGVKNTHNKIAQRVVGGYQKIENGVVGTFTKISDKFVDAYLTQENESVEDAKKRLAEEQRSREKSKSNNRRI